MVDLFGRASLLFYDDFLLFALFFALYTIGKVFLVLQAGDVLDDARHCLVVFHHLLVVTPALIRRPRAHFMADHDVDLHQSAHGCASLKQFYVLFEERLVLEVLLKRPVAYVDPLSLLFDLIQPLSLLKHLLPVSHHLVLTFTLRARVCHELGNGRGFMRSWAFFHY